MPSHVPTSKILERLMQEAPTDRVTLGWILEHLKERSFGIVMLLIALVGLLPGASLFAGLLLFVPAIQMILGRAVPALPRRIAARKFSTTRLERLVRRMIPALRLLERVVRPRWGIHFETRKRVVGSVMLLLGATMLIPVPFSHVIPTLTIMLLAFAFLEEDGLLLACAYFTALLSLVLSAAAIWSAVEVGLLV
ncbi:exopolysaccharide biosynthesis protein [Fodinicurvata fenggangensis]|uniref:exopolysaccharide biosynthesis protein n=1 Tax=Fodinicurvata fenggangensis TaxID=1121830 RepID=UPI000558E419|nr:exopolysaccharide biosynthesis protein [Fodinicurvata fenggangensis]